MPANCSSMNGVLEYDISQHTVTFESGKNLQISDCAGDTKFVCDVSQHTLCIEVSEVNGNHMIRVGRPVDLPIGSPIFTTVLDLSDVSTVVLFEKHIQEIDVDMIGTHDLRYECTDEAFVTADNGYKRYVYRLSQCRLKLQKVGTNLYIECACADDPCGSQAHPGFRVTTALKP